MRSSISSASGGLAGLNASIFQAAAAASDRPSGGLKPQQRPATYRDPLRWFSVLPPLSLRKAQKCFRRAAEASVQLANAQLRMAHHGALYEQLCRSSGHEHLLQALTEAKAEAKLSTAQEGAK